MLDETDVYRLMCDSKITLSDYGPDEKLTKDSRGASQTLFSNL